MAENGLRRGGGEIPKGAVISDQIIIIRGLHPDDGAEFVSIQIGDQTSILNTIGLLEAAKTWVTDLTGNVGLRAEE